MRSQDDSVGSFLKVNEGYCNNPGRGRVLRNSYRGRNRVGRHSPPGVASSSPTRLRGSNPGLNAVAPLGQVEFRKVIAGVRIELCTHAIDPSTPWAVSSHCQVNARGRNDKGFWSDPEAF